MSSLSRMKGTRAIRRLAAVSSLALAATGLTLVTAAPAHAAVACKVTYNQQSQWNTGFSVNLTIQNQGEALNGWTLGFAFDNTDQKVAQGWSATWSQSGASVTAKSVDWNKNLAANGSVSIGFNGSQTSTHSTQPTQFTINGTVCGGTPPSSAPPSSKPPSSAPPSSPPPVNHAPTVTITSPIAGTRYTAPANIAMTATATDPDSGDSISKVEFYHDGLLLGTDTSSPYSYTWANVPAQTTAYHLQAIAYDSHNAPSSTSDVPVYVDASSNPAVVTSAASVTVKPGDSQTFTVTLSKAPSSDVTVNVARSSGDTGITASPEQLTFTSSDYDTPQTVTVSAASSTTNASTAVIGLSGTGVTSANVNVTVDDGTKPDYITNFNTMYDLIHSSSSGYFSPEGIPYHSIETFIVEAPDQGHETTSEAFSYWLWLEAEHGQVTGDWTPFNTAWTTMEKYIIPSHADQPTNSFYNASKPATYAPEWPLPSNYPSAMDSSVTPGTDPLASELSSAYGTSDIYSMHWLMDVDNTYGFGGYCPDTSRGHVAYINTYQRGPQESVFETIPQPDCDTFKSGGPNGYLDLFIKDSSYAKQWKYTNAPDADARAVQAAYWAYTWASAQGKASQVSTAVANAAKMGDYLRYDMYDKYFKAPGCTSPSCTPGSGKSASNYLMSWYMAWGGAMDTSAGWAWRIGSSHFHQAYQNPLAAYALANVAAMKPKSSTGQQDWSTSVNRQIEFYTWLQSAEGAFAGGATNSWNGNYSAPPSGTPTFYGLAYDWQPVYHDPPSNQWFGFQAWPVERIAEYYYVSGDTKAKAILDKWVAWAMKYTKINSDGTYQIPSTLTWTGQPGGNWKSGTTSVDNSNLHVTVKDYTNDVGVTGSYAKLLAYYAAKSGNTDAKAMAKALLDGIWLNRDSKGVSVPETKTDYNRLDDPYNSSTGDGLYVPSGWSGKYPNGDAIKPGVSFLDIRSWYKNDPDYKSKVAPYLAGTGPAPVFNYHRFWAEVDVAVAYSDYARLFPNG